MLCTTNIWIKIQKCAIPHKNLYFLPTFVPENSSQETKNGPFGNVIREDPEQLAAVCAELGMPRFAAKQLARWLYAKHVEDPMRMSDIAAAHRAKLAERFRPHSPRPRGSPNRPTERKSTSTARSRAHGSNRPTFPTASGPRCASRRRPDAAWDANSARRDGRGCNTR